MKVLVRLLALIVLIAVVVKVSFVIADEKTKSLAWGTLKDNILSSVAWSPDGRTIAFVATPDMHGRSMKGEGDTPDKASIWLVPVGTQLGAPRLLYTAKVGDRGDGVPIGLFWLSKEELVWATDGCKFYSINTRSGRSKQLINMSMGLNQSRAHPEWNGLDDVYYDAATHRLLFTGMCASIGSGKTSSNVICIYHTDDRNLEIYPLPSDIVAKACVSSQGDYPDIPQYYVSGLVEKSDESVMSVWHSSGRWAQLIELATVKGEVFFPRPSPNGQRLLWIENSWSKEDAKWEMVLMDLNTKFRSIIVHLPSELWCDTMPALGCPFAWSPKGDEVAYADGARIRVVVAPYNKND